MNAVSYILFYAPKVECDVLALDGLKGLEFSSENREQLQSFFNATSTVTTVLFIWRTAYSFFTTNVKGYFSVEYHTSLNEFNGLCSYLRPSLSIKTILSSARYKIIMCPTFNNGTIFKDYNFVCMSSNSPLT